MDLLVFLTSNDQSLDRTTIHQTFADIQVPLRNRSLTLPQTRLQQGRSVQHACLRLGGLVSLDASSEPYPQQTEIVHVSV